MPSHVSSRHRRTSPAGAIAVVIIGTCSLLASPLRAQEKVDVATIEKIKTEEMNHGQVMDIMSWLSDVYGPRLTWSPNATRAKVWAMDQMKSWGLSSVHEEKWDTPAGLGWENERFSFMAIAPMPFIVQAVPRAWSGSTKGTVTGPATMVQAGCLDELKANRADLATLIESGELCREVEERVPHDRAGSKPPGGRVHGARLPLHR